MFLPRGLVWPQKLFTAEHSLSNEIAVKFKIFYIAGPLLCL